MDQSPHATLCGIPPNRIAGFFPRNKSNTTIEVVLRLLFKHNNREKRRAETFAMCK